MFILFFALLVLLLSSLPWVAISRPSSKPAWVMALYLIGSANLTLSLYIANSFYALNQRWAILALHILLGGIGWLIWQRTGRPSLWAPFQNWRIKFDVQWIWREPILALLTLGVAVSYIFALVQIIVIPQNNMDSLSTHLSRIGFWLQHGSFFPWQTTLLNQVWYPVNAQLQTYWTLLFLGNDHMVGSVQWLAAMISGMGVFGMARLQGYHHRSSAFAALIFMSFPLVALQSTTTQTDLVTVAFFIPAVYFLTLGVREGRYSLLTLSAISVGLGIGVKKSYFILLPVLAVMALLVFLRYGKRTWKPLLIWSVNLVVAVVLLGSYIYVVNWKYFGDPFGSPDYIDTMLDIPQSRYETPGKFDLARVSRQDSSASVSNDSALNRNIFLEVVYNAPRLFYQALDTSGLPRPLDGYSHKVKMRLARAFFQGIGFEEIEGTAYTAPGHVFSFSDKNINEESHAWYGPLSVLLIFPALLIQTWRGLRQRDWLMLGPGLALLIFVPLEIILRPGWDPFQGRYFAPLVALCAPLMTTWFKEKGYPVHEWFIAILSVIILAVTLLYNPSKPTLGKFADEFHVWSNTRIFVQTIQRKDNRDVYYMVDEFVPADSTLGYYVPFFILDYPFFGENMSRRLVPLSSPSQVSDLQWLRAQGIGYLLLPKADGYPTPPVEYQAVRHLKDWKLYIYTPTP
jgi:4-amino-4-deoxy-L-arabinose transferase-like glycosyltransferase